MGGLLCRGTVPPLYHPLHPEAGEQEAPPAGATEEPDISPDPVHLPRVPPTGVGLAQDEGIPDLDIKGRAHCPTPDRPPLMPG
jgi:hypothetical protein